MLISYNWLRELVRTELGARTLAERLTMVGLTVDTVHEAGDDYVIEVDLTSNRPDCLSHLGVAREVAAIERSTSDAASLPQANGFARRGRAAEYAGVEVRDADLCARYAARVVRGVHVASSPAWLADRLMRIGSRPINNVTDITNYVLHETGQPLHAFDLARLTGNQIIVRRASAGETIRTLDEAERTLDEQMLVIADAERAVAIAGVMGGFDSSITDATSDVLIESAYFDRASVRRTARKLNLHTDASHRFERGTDPEGVLRAQERAVELICELAGGTATEDAIDVYPRRVTRGGATLRSARIGEVLGINVAPEEAHRILTSLGFTIDDAADDAGASDVNIHSFSFWTDNREPPTTSESRAGASRRYVAPSWRVDISREEDLIEEVARLTGYDSIPIELPRANTGGAYLPGEDRRRGLRRALTGAGFSEAINFSFVSPVSDEMYELLPTTNERAHDPESANFIALPNPVIEDLTRMRLSLLPGLLAAARHNRDRGTRDVRLFEIGNVFRAASAGEERPDETEAFAIIATGARREAERAGGKDEIDFYDLKGALETAVERMNVSRLAFVPDDDVRHLRRGQSARVLLGGVHVGTAGRLADDIAAIYKLRQPVYVAELRLDRLLAADAARSRYRPLARFPAITRDATVTIERSRTLDELRRRVASLESPTLRDVLFVDAYEGEPVPAGMRSVTLRFEYRADDRTLRDEEVDTAHAAVIERLNAVE